MERRENGVPYRNYLVCWNEFNSLAWMTEQEADALREEHTINWVLIEMEEGHVHFTGDEINHPNHEEGTSYDIDQ